MTEWDAERYHRLSEPQVAWGQRVLDRLAPAAGETILDIGCGTGRLTAQLAAAAGHGIVIGLDRSRAMLAQAGEWLARQAPRVHLVRGDAAALPFAESFDAVFSAATLHWVPDHAAAFRNIFRALRPGGRLVAQCGGGPNLARLLARTHDLMSSRRFARYFGAWQDPWYFADEPSTVTELQRAGFDDIDVSLEPAPLTLRDAAAYADFIACVCIRHHVDRLPPRRRAEFVRALAAAARDDDPPYTLDYWRLNISARKAPADEAAA
jgi:ubiquinone/menaquinone biosynthesis C-methylase UbiE